VLFKRWISLIVFDDILQVILPPTEPPVELSRQFGGLEGLQIQLSKAVVTNCYVGDSGSRSRSNLQPVIRSLGSSCVVWEGRAPMDFTAPHGTAYVTKLLQRHANGDDKSICLTAEMVADHGGRGKPTTLLTDGLSANRFLHTDLAVVNVTLGGLVAEWLARWTQVQKGPRLNRSRDAVG